jgi:hypothetical protein
LLKLKDKTGKVRFVIRDSDTGPVEVDKVILEDDRNNDDEDDPGSKEEEQE